MTSWAERQRDADATWRHTRMTAERVPCTECSALEGETCRNVHTGQPLEHQPAHAKRIKAASEEAS